MPGLCNPYYNMINITRSIWSALRCRKSVSALCASLLILTSGGCALVPTGLCLTIVDASTGRPVIGVQPLEEDIRHNTPFWADSVRFIRWPRTDNNGVTKRYVDLGVINGIVISSDAYQDAVIRSKWRHDYWGTLDEDHVSVESPANVNNPSDRSVIVSTHQDIVIPLYR
jgi:hypothetical protein